MKRTKILGGGVHNLLVFTLTIVLLLFSVIAVNADPITITKKWNDNLTKEDATNRTPPKVVVNATMTEEEMFNFLYPVGSVYETNDASFNPNNKWYGIWEEDDAGRVLVSAGSNDSVTYTTGSKGGEKTHTLTPDETASKAHSHTYTKSNTSTDNTTLTIEQIPSHSGHLPVNSGPCFGYGNTTLYLDVSTMASYGSAGRGWNIHSNNEILPAGVSRGGGQGHNHGITLTNTATAENPSDDNGTAHNNMQPYKVIKRWRRTA